MSRKHFNVGRRTFLKSIGVAGTGAYLCAAGLIPGRAAAAAHDKIVIGYLPVNAETVAYRGGTDFWKQQGLNVDLYRAPGGPAIVEAMISGSIPAGDIGNGPAIIAAARGFPFYYLTIGAVATPQQSYSRIMVRPDSDIRTVHDLRGRTIALHQRGTMEDLSLGALEKRHGIKKSELKITLIPYPNQPQALAQGLVDAIYSVPPSDATAEHKFGMRTLIRTSEFLPWLGYTTLAVRRDFADKNPDSVKRLIKGWILTSRWIRDNAAAARTVSNEFLGIPGDIGAHVTLPQWLKNPLPVMPNIWHIYHMLTGAQMIKPVDDPAKLIDDYFVKPANAFTLPALEDLGIVDDPLQSAMIGGDYPLLPKPNSAYYAPWETKLVKS